MTHPLLKILEDIQKEYEFDYAYCGSSSGITRLIDKREAQRLAAFEARDLAVAKAVYDECLDVAHYEDSYSLIGDIADDLEEIIKGVK